MKAKTPVLALAAEGSSIDTLKLRLSSMGMSPIAVPVRDVPSALLLFDAAAERARVTIIDLGHETERMLEVCERMSGVRWSQQGGIIVGLYPATPPDAQEKALRAGCDYVLPRSFGKEDLEFPLSRLADCPVSFSRADGFSLRLLELPGTPTLLVTAVRDEWLKLEGELGAVSDHGVRAELEIGESRPIPGYLKVYERNGRDWLVRITGMRAADQDRVAAQLARIAHALEHERAARAGFQGEIGVLDPETQLIARWLGHLIDPVVPEPPKEGEVPQENLRSALESLSAVERDALVRVGQAESSWARTFPALRMRLDHLAARTPGPMAPDPERESFRERGAALLRLLSNSLSAWAIQAKKDGSYTGPVRESAHAALEAAIRLRGQHDRFRQPGDEELFARIETADDYFISTMDLERLPNAAATFEWAPEPEEKAASARYELAPGRSGPTRTRVGVLLGALPLLLLGVGLLAHQFVAGGGGAALAAIDPLSEVSPLLEQGYQSVGDEFSTFIGRIDIERWQRLPPKQRQTEAEQIAKALDRRGISSAVVYGEGHIAVQIDGGKLLMVR